MKNYNIILAALIGLTLLLGLTKCKPEIPLTMEVQNAAAYAAAKYDWYNNPNSDNELPKEQLDSLQKALHVLQSTTLDSSIAKCLLVKAWHDYLSYDYIAVKDSLDKAVSRLDKYSQNNLLGDVFSLIAMNYEKLSNTDLSIQYSEKAILIYLQLKSFSEVAIEYGNQTNTYTSAGAYKQAIETGDKAIDILKQYPTDPDQNLYLVALANNNKSNAYSLLGYNNILQNEKKRAQEYFQQALTSLKTIPITPQTPLEAIYLNIGINHLNIDNSVDIDSAVYYLKNALDSATNKKKYLEQSYASMSMALAYAKKKDAKNAFKLGKKSLENFGYKSNSFLDNPSIDQLHFPNLPVLFKMLRLKGQTLKTLYDSNNDKQYLVASFKAYQRAIEVIDLLQLTKEETNPASPLYRLTYLEAINICDVLYKVTSDKKYADEAFYLSERSKKVILRKMLYQKNIDETKNHEYDIKTLILEERQYIAEIRKFSDGYSTVSDMEKRARIANMIFKLKKDYQHFIDSIQKSTFPRDKYYVKIRDFKNESPNIDYFQKRVLDDTTALIEYFFRGNEPKAWLITSKNKTYFSLPLSQEFNKALSDMQNPDLNLKEYKDRKSAFQVYQDVLNPILTKLNNPRINRLIIIPDNQLTEIPFEALCTSELGDEFILDKYTVSYNYSMATYDLSDILSVTNRAAKPFAAFIGHYVDSKYALPAMTKMIRTELSFNNPYIDDKANVQTFKKVAPNFDIIHFVMHGYLGTQRSLDSYLAFSNNAENDDKLTVFEISQMSLAARMIVLSSCNTEKDILKSHESLSTIATAFVAAGSSTVIGTLQQINDTDSAPIFKDFYYYLLQEHYPADVALTLAKRKHRFSKPSAWSNIILIGKPYRFSSK